jgi:uncharacterized membrane protein YdjX (TVP38/TMEM64 family)|tara:strand:+ start:876 stop:1595 length:720 start_codon:yes stop_codon:yes gene_type:complete
MQKTKNIKIIIGLFYLILLFIFLYLFFSKFTLEEITTYKFIQANREYLANIKQTNTILLLFAFLIFTIIWVLILGFASPILLAAGFIFGKWLGVLLAVGSLSIGATILYIFAGYFFKDLIKEKFLNKFKNLETKFKKNEFIFFLIYRFVGGIPFQIANLLPILFNVKRKNYFFGSFLGIMPQGFIVTSLGSGISEIIKNNDTVPSLLDLLSSNEIYLPILGFIFLVFLTIILKKFFYKN